MSIRCQCENLTHENGCNEDAVRLFEVKIFGIKETLALCKDCVIEYQQLMDDYKRE